MSDLLIKDVGLPNPNEVLWLAISHDGTVKEGYGQITDSKAIEVPTHGRLIDADKLLNDFSECEMKSYGYNGSCEDCEDRNICMVRVLLKDIENAPTVLEASE